MKCILFLIKNKTEKYEIRLVRWRWSLQNKCFCVPMSLRLLCRARCPLLPRREQWPSWVRRYLQSHQHVSPPDSGMREPMLTPRQGASGGCCSPGHDHAADFAVPYVPRSWVSQRHCYFSCLISTPSLKSLGEGWGALLLEKELLPSRSSLKGRNKYF